MNARKIGKMMLTTDPGWVRAQLDELSAVLAATDRAAGKRLCAVAEELVRRGLEVSIIGYHDTWWELEAILPQARQMGPVMVYRDASGSGCQLAWERWADIASQDDARHAADMLAALLHGLAHCAPLTEPRPGIARHDPEPSDPGPPANET